MKVLLAEDDSASRILFSRWLAKWGYQVTAVGDGQAALQALRADPSLRLCVMDWMMPGLDGIDVCRAIRARREPYVYVILLTGKTDKDDVVRGLEAGADDYIVKPFAARELLARVAAALHLARVRAEASAALQESEERYRSLTEATSQIIWATDAAGRWSTPSPSYERYTGLRWEQYRDGSSPAVHPDDLPRIRAEWESVLRGGTAGEMRFSNFLLWQVSYTELHVTPSCWPEFRDEHLDEAFESYARRVRKFGGLVPGTASG